MHIAWGSLLVVFVVSFGSAVAVVTLVALALRALSPRADSDPAGTGAVQAGSSGGRAIAGLCITAAALIVLYGLYVIVAH